MTITLTSGQFIALAVLLTYIGAVTGLACALWIDARAASRRIRELNDASDTPY